MRRCYFFTPIQTVPHEAWSELYRAINPILHHRVRNESVFCWLGKPLTVYDHSGTQPLRYDGEVWWGWALSPLTVILAQACQVTLFAWFGCVLPNGGKVSAIPSITLTIFW